MHTHTHSYTHVHNTHSLIGAEGTLMVAYDPSDIQAWTFPNDVDSYQPRNLSVKGIIRILISIYHIRICINAYMYVYIYMHTCTYIYTCIHVRMYIHAYMYVYIYLHTCTYIYTYVRVRVYIHTYMYVYIYIHTCTHHHWTLSNDVDVCEVCVCVWVCVDWCVS